MLYLSLIAYAVCCGGKASPLALASLVQTSQALDRHESSYANSKCTESLSYISSQEKCVSNYSPNYVYWIKTRLDIMFIHEQKHSNLTSTYTETFVSFFRLSAGHLHPIWSQFYFYYSWKNVYRAWIVVQTQATWKTTNAVWHYFE